MFFSSLYQRASGRISREALARKAGITQTSFLPFGDYPMADNMRLTVAVAQVLFPNRSLGHAMRELGNGAFDAFLGSHLGRIVFGALEIDPSSLFRSTPRIFSALFNFGRLEYQRVSYGHCRLIATRLPMFIETFQVGTVEAALRYTRCTGTIELALDSIADGIVDVHWQHGGEATMLRSR